MLNNDTIATGLRRLATTTSDNGEELPLLFACWGAQAAFAVCKPLPTATAALHAALADNGLTDGLPAACLTATLEGSALEWGDGSADPLIGIGLLATTSTESGEQPVAWIAMSDGAALTWQSITPPKGMPENPTGAHLRIEADMPLWHETEAILAPLERFRATVTGWPPRLPERLRGPAGYYPPSTPAWTGPC